MVKFDDREVYYGTIDIEMKSLLGSDQGNLSLRYEPKTDNLDISLTSGNMDTSAMIPFGKPFLTWDDLDKIDAIKGGVKQDELTE
ncbi:hypothetical protein [Paenibacillus sp. DCT19]|uniref:hypothetical protein n=1 Tax=Paenibacillus sp. DCT19 TaxID=2211212 RepID=UPI000FE1DE35|nr:hypothetical protein [Paenibacillus sp. DCT19]